MKKQIVNATVWLLLFAMLLSMVSCSTGEQEPAATKESSTPAVSSSQGSEQSVVSESLDYPIVTEPVTLTYWVNMQPAAAAVLKDYSEKLVYQELEEITGITLNFLHPAVGQQDEAFNLLLASGDLPDIIEYNNWPKYAGGPEAAIEDRVIVPLNELIDQYAPNYKGRIDSSERIEKQLKTDIGTLWAFNMIAADEEPWAGPVIRQDFLDELDLTMPATIEDWHVTLTAFKEKLQVEAPLSFIPAAFTTYGAFIGAYDIKRDFYIGTDNAVHYGPIEDEFKQFLETFHAWYSEGLIDKEFASTDDKVRNANNTTGKTGAWVGSVAENLGAYNMTVQGENPAYHAVAAPYPALTQGQEVRFRQQSEPVRSYWTVITTKCEYPAEAVRMLDYGYSEEGSMMYTFGFEDLSYTLVNGDPQPTELLTNDENGVALINVINKYAGRAGPFVKDYREANFIAVDPDQKAAGKVWLSASSDGNMPPITLLADEDQRYASIMNEINIYADEMYLKFIMGLEPIDKFDDYVSQMKAMGIEEALAIQQAAYGRYISR